MTNLYFSFLPKQQISRLFTQLIFVFSFYSSVLGFVFSIFQSAFLTFGHQVAI